jgi:hypothetical protein
MVEWEDSRTNVSDYSSVSLLIGSLPYQQPDISGFIDLQAEVDHDDDSDLSNDESEYDGVHGK